MVMRPSVKPICERPVVYFSMSAHFKISLTVYVFPQSAELATLTDVSFEVKAGELLAVIGPVGAGKVRTFVLYSSGGSWGRVHGRCVMVYGYTGYIQSINE